MDLMGTVHCISWGAACVSPTPEGSVTTIGVVVGEGDRELTATARQTRGDRGGQALPHRPRHQDPALKSVQISFAKQNQWT